MTGRGTYLEDISIEGGWHAVFVRSMEAHALIGSVEMPEDAPPDTKMFTASDLDLLATMPIQNPSPLIDQPINAPPLAHSETCYVGQPIAVVVGATIQAATDAAETVEVEYQTMPAVIDYRDALSPGSATAHKDADSNLIATLIAGYGDIDKSFADAPRSTTITVDQHRGALASLECRGVFARWEPGDSLTLWTSSQSPHAVRAHVASYLGLSPDELRVATPDVGGGFGPKAAVYAEEYVLAALARYLESSVRWVERRREHFTATLQQRGQCGRVEVAYDDQGRILGLRARLVHDFGAYVPYGMVVPVTTLRLMSGPYVIPAIDARIDCVFTNTTPTVAIRGAGRPNAVFVVERAMDAIAAGTGIDRAEVRRRNFIPADDLPYQIALPGAEGRPVEYDSGDYKTALDTAVRAADVDDFETRRHASERRGLLRGYGIASYVEDTGIGPYDGARLEVLTNGEVLVETGAASQGQGHATVFAQIVANHLGVDPQAVRVHGGDTRRYGQGIGTIASRSGQTAGSAVHIAAIELAGDVRRRAAAKLEAAEEDIVLQGGFAMVVGQPGTEVPLSRLAAEAQPGPGASLTPGQRTPGLSYEGIQAFEGAAYTFGTHVAEVEIDPETGRIVVVAYTVVHDCGTMLNPMIVDGQVDGGVAHGLGNALRESIHYSDDGQPLSVSFMDYLLVTANDMPPLEKVHTETPSPFNPLGAKGAGEGGTIPVAAAVASAIEHALHIPGLRVDHYPVTSEWVHNSLTRR
ncbi:MAG TPA: xanthine dehydrogenase family protein molybdopterin-binding subunit [Acidimicrobiia bacterium]|nr:xanthine dehydrogenase family protein molybdopterin-binding subunit [Acidimicrobiia bacterium]